MNSKILVTGGTGFIGQHLVERLLEEGHRVRVMSRRQPTATKNGLYEHVAGDFTNADDAARAVQDVDVVYHLAVTTVPGTSNSKIQFDAHTNLLGSLNLVESAAIAGVERFIFISSGGSVYGPTAHSPISEEHPTNPISAHGVSKLAVEKYLEIYRRKYGMEYRIARASNPYGEGQDPERGQGIVAHTLHCLAQDKELVIWGDGSVVRDFIYVKDVVDALWLFLNDAGPHRLYHVGSGVGRSINEMITRLEEVSGTALKVHYDAGRPADVPYNCLDMTRIRISLGWKPETDLHTGLQRTWSWIQQRAREPEMQANAPSLAT